MSVENEAISVLTKVIKNTCERLISKAKYDKTVRGVVVGLPNSNSSFYTVQVNGGKYEIPNYSGQKMNIGNGVLVLIPCNNFADMCIISSCH